MPNFEHIDVDIKLEQAKRQEELAAMSAGLDALETNAKPERKIGKRILKAIAPLAAVVLVLAIWQAVCFAHLLESWILPSPKMVLQALIAQYEQGILLESAFNSLRRGVQGFLISLAIATPIGIALGLNSTARAIFRPIVTGLQQLPSVAWVPAAIIWFGLSDATIFAVVLLGAVPSITNGLISGIDQIPPIYLRVGKVLGAKGFGSITNILIPAAWPGYLSGLEQGWAFAWRSLMAAELIAVSPSLGQGLGLMLDTGRQLGDMALVLGSIIVIMIVGVLVERAIFAPIRTRTLRNRGLLVSR
jgi:NitT/TauT family transport system permease protein